MKVIALVENTTISKSLIKKHGLSLYIELDHIRLILDTGPDGSFLKNASRLGIDINSIDYLIISHGHIDHGGGIEKFLEVNKTAVVLASREAFDDHYTNILGNIKAQIGISKVQKFRHRIQYIYGTMQIDKEICLFDSVSGSRLLPKGNSKLLKQTEFGIIKDDFAHEVYLSIKHENKRLLFSSCSHRGIVNIIEQYKKIHGMPPTHVFAGFHLYNPVSRRRESNELINSLAQELFHFEDTKYYTFHCTGVTAYKQLKNIIGERIITLSTGSCIEL